jgi:RecQ zinc-binding
VTNNGSSNARKNENVHALYAMLAYCEETYLCRRFLQLRFLGEKFDSTKCNNMCDNCKQASGQGLKIEKVDYSSHAKTLVQFVQNCYNQK